MSIDLDKGGACRGCSVRRLSDQWTRPADFPAINPSFANRRNRFVYAGAASGSRRFLPFFPFDSVVKVDVSDGSARLWSAVGRKFVGEPVFVPAGGREEDDGYVLLVEVGSTFPPPTRINADPVIPIGIASSCFACFFAVCSI